MVREIRNVFIGLELNRLLGLSKLDHFHIMSNLSLMWPLFFRLARHDLLGSCIHGGSLAYVTTACEALIKTVLKVAPRPSPLSLFSEGSICHSMQMIPPAGRVCPS